MLPSLQAKAEGVVGFPSNPVSADVWLQYCLGPDDTSIKTKYAHEVAYRVVKFYRFMHEETKNFLFLWIAYRVSRIARIPVADWILISFDDAAQELGALNDTWRLELSDELTGRKDADTSRRNNRFDRYKRRILNAFGIVTGGAGNPFDDFSDTAWIFRGAAVEVTLQENPSWNETGAINKVSEQSNVADSVTREDYKKYLAFKSKYF